LEGKSHLFVGLTAGVVLDSVTHLSGPPVTLVTSVSLALLLKKGIYYFMVGFGSLLPDADNARSTIGQKLGWLSKEIQHLAGHRTLLHSLLGLALGAFVALGLQQLVIYLLDQRGYLLSAEFVSTSHLILVAVLFGCITHLVADGLTEGGIPLLWPSHRRFGFPPNPRLRFRTGTWPEHIIVFTFMVLVGLGIWQSWLFL
jgi:membrane-bound metal-dependent hydrolase YbcI (DUF457 family)